MIQDTTSGSIIIYSPSLTLLSDLLIRRMSIRTSCPGRTSLDLVLMEALTFLQLDKATAPARMYKRG